MSDKDHFLARWSRRKAEVKTAEEQPESAAPQPLAEEADAEPELAAETVDEPLEPLPRIEDLTADSDLTAFFRKNVPAALRNAALRRVWSLDPAIRDYVGPADYAWDFNQPGSMAGFGPSDPLSRAGEFAAEQILKGRSPAAEPTLPADVADPGARSRPQPQTALSSLPPPEPPAAPVPPVATGAPEASEPGPEPAAARSDEAAEPALQPQRPRRHGSALPR